MKDTQSVRPAGSHVESGNEFYGAGSSSDGNRGEFSSGPGEPRPARVRERLVMTVAAALFVSAFMAACGFFISPSLSSMYISPPVTMIATSSTAQLAAHGMYSDGSQSEISGDKVSWSSSDTTVATVSSPGGLVTGVSVGTATITATTTTTIPSSGCQVVVSGGSFSKSCPAGGTETITATANVSVTATDANNTAIPTTKPFMR